MDASYEGKQIVGMDVHRRRSVLVRMTEAGERLESTRITNDPEYLREVMSRAGEAPEVVLEATYGWFGLLTDQLIRRGVHKSVIDLERDVRAWIEHWNDDPKPFTWTKTADEILTSLASYLTKIQPKDENELTCTTDDAGH